MYRSPGARTVGRPNQPICIRDPATHLPAVHPASPPQQQQQQQQQHSFRPLPCFVIDGDGICECRSWALATWPTTLSDGQVFHSASDAFFVVQAAKQPSSHAAMQPSTMQLMQAAAPCAPPRASTASTPSTLTPNLAQSRPARLLDGLRDSATPATRARLPDCATVFGSPLLGTSDCHRPPSLHRALWLASSCLLAPQLHVCLSFSS
jgi:hypothetical protein